MQLRCRQEVQSEDGLQIAVPAPSSCSCTSALPDIDWELAHADGNVWPESRLYHGTDQFCPDLIGWQIRSPLRHRKVYIRSLAMQPGTPAFKHTFDQLPDWVKCYLPPAEPFEDFREAWRRTYGANRPPDTHGSALYYLRDFDVGIL